MNIILKDIRLFGYHGVHPLENMCGTEFIINIVIVMDNNHRIKILSDTIDYAAVYSVMKKVFSMPEQLLEVVAEKIFVAIAESFPIASEIDISIMKSNPPIEGFLGQVGIQLKKRTSEI
ncbi:MAG: dihydroneopterin aldolase [Chitinophagaceae bacterium]|jgi:dihydroneopterin aldolase|nr:dihydroneopterin aldolase [Chitinophagaceae bacterium]